MTCLYQQRRHQHDTCVPPQVSLHKCARHSKQCSDTTRSCRQALAQPSWVLYPACRQTGAASSSALVCLFPRHESRIALTRQPAKTEGQEGTQPSAEQEEGPGQRVLELQVWLGLGTHHIHNSGTWARRFNELHCTWMAPAWSKMPCGERSVRSASMATLSPLKPELRAEPAVKEFASRFSAAGGLSVASTAPVYSRI